MKKRIIAGLMAVIMLMGMTSAMAAGTITTDGGTGETTVTLTAEAATFNVTVPTSLAIKVNADGTVTPPTNVAIANASPAPVKVTTVAMNKGAWSLVAYDGFEPATEKVNAKKLAFSLTADNTAVKTGSTDATQTLGTPGWTIAAKNGSLPITVAAKASAVSEAISTAETAATVVFTIAWAD